jgi:hypothetical protein
MAVDPSTLVEVICATPGICANCVSSGWATAEAMVSGLAPGKLAETWIVGKSTCGSGYTTMPANRMPIINNVVAIGCRMNGPEMPSPMVKAPSAG